jgi:hypothetical protein
MSTTWSEEQRRCLGALGYTLYRPISPGVAPADSARMVANADPLSRAVLRAAGLDPARIADPSSWLLAQGMPAAAQLRGDPAAKRALWPKLRALRSGVASS